MYAKLILVGNLGGDPQMRYTPAGHPVTNFSLAVNRSFKNSEGEVVKQVTWFRVAAWGKLAEVVNQYLSKGRQVLVEGRLASDAVTHGPRVWTDKDGKARSSYEVTAETVKFLGSKGPSDEAEATEDEATPEAAPEEDAIPF